MLAPVEISYKAAAHPYLKFNYVSAKLKLARDSFLMKIITNGLR